ncbi:pimeloyl-ACP methyl ester carboxylesterase [Crossiella equi]|uniref:Pimeloyl-ACP methyl ester carboxylesterase n=1 Tax=Crossiella equi TaxID=130796 RepID=A0ABS5A3R1_9PSEU|nr:alpha/beta hydrolase [Crossiella equi]MBP2471211.1 pimeloyl-ACP methyl ester carboxylesterase [Crossiella equi]
MRKILSTVVAVAVLATPALTGTAQAAAPSGVRWGPCPADVPFPGLECGTLDVPLDYRAPDGRRIQLAVSRLASKNPAKRKGVLFTNPGGPGGGGLSLPFLLTVIGGTGLPQEVRDAYDIIGIDPRGVGHSTPVRCGFTEDELKYNNLPVYAHNSDDVVKWAEKAKSIAQRCATSASAPLLPHLTTANAARDMDRLRTALGERKIAYLGYSYGTWLGAVYTTLFPNRDDRIVLDSSLGPTGLDRTGTRMFGRGMEDTFPDFAAYAAAHPEYGLGRTPEQVRAKFFELAEELDRQPHEGADGTVFRALTHAKFYGHAGANFELLAKYWRAYDTRGPLPTEPVNPFPPDTDNLMSAYHAVICADSNWPRSVASYQHDVAIDRVRHPLWGASVANIRACAFWGDPVEAPVRVSDRGPENVLLAQNTRDAGTPLAGARRMRDALGDRVRMVTADQSGHGAYVFTPNQCLNTAVTRFLMDGERPRRHLSC